VCPAGAAPFADAALISRVTGDAFLRLAEDMRRLHVDKAVIGAQNDHEVRGCGVRLWRCRAFGVLCRAFGMAGVLEDCSLASES
jgi:hypothetical protein